MPESDNFDYLFKIVLAGDSGVGKSNILTRYVNNQFSTKTSSTIGVDFLTRNTVINEKKIRAIVWDTAGQEQFRTVTNAYYRGAVGAVLIYDITSYESFLSVSSWLKEIREFAGSQVVVVLVGNKSDLKHLRAVSTDEAADFAQNNSLSFLETSALDSTNIEQAFENVLIDVYSLENNNRRPSQQLRLEETRKLNVDLKKKNSNKKESKCC